MHIWPKSSVLSESAHHLPCLDFIFPSEICNPYSKELLTWWTFVVLVNAAIEVSRLVKTCALAAANGVCSEQGVQAQSFLSVCVQCGGGWRRRGKASQLDSIFPTSLWTIPESLSWNLFVGIIGVIRSMEFFFQAVKIDIGISCQNLIPWGNISSAQTTVKSMHMHLRKDSRLIWAGHREL